MEVVEIVLTVLYVFCELPAVFEYIVSLVVVQVLPLPAALSFKAFWIFDEMLVMYPSFVPAKDKQPFVLFTDIASPPRAVRK